MQHRERKASTGYIGSFYRLLILYSFRSAAWVFWGSRLDLVRCHALEHRDQRTPHTNLPPHAGHSKSVRSAGGNFTHTASSQALGEIDFLRTGLAKVLHRRAASLHGSGTVTQANRPTRIISAHHGARLRRPKSLDGRRFVRKRSPWR